MWMDRLRVRHDAAHLRPAGLRGPRLASASRRARQTAQLERQASGRRSSIERSAARPTSMPICASSCAAWHRRRDEVGDGGLGVVLGARGGRRVARGGDLALGRGARLVGGGASRRRLGGGGACAAAAALRRLGGAAGLGAASLRGSRGARARLRRRRLGRGVRAASRPPRALAAFGFASAFALAPASPWTSPSRARRRSALAFAFGFGGGLRRRGRRRRRFAAGRRGPLGALGAAPHGPRARQARHDLALGIVVGRAQCA